MGLKINEEEIEKNFFENMNQAKKFIENAESSFNVLRIPADFEFYKTIINMQSDIKDNIRNVEEIYDSIHSYIEDIKNVEKNNEDLINSLSWESNSSDNNNVNEIDNKTTEVSYGSTEFELLDEDTNGYIKGLDNSISKMEDRIGEIDKRLSELEVEIQDTITHSQIEHVESNQSKNETTTMTTAEVEKEGNKKQKEEKKSTEENSTSNYEELKEKLKKEEEDLKQEKEKLNNDIQNIKTSITYMERLLKEANTLKEYYNITKSDDYKNFKVNKDRPELTEILWEEGTDGLIPINEDIYYKYNPLLIAEHICDIYEGQYAYNDSDVKMIDYYKSGSGELSKYLSWYVYMTQDQRDMYNYLYEKQGIDSADEYARKLEQTEFWNMQKGQYQAETFLESLDYEKDKDGNYVPTKDSLNKILKSFDEGASDGIDSFSEGLENLFKSNVEMTDLQYKQIIIYQYLSTINQKSYSFGQSYGNTIVPTLIGTITGTSLLGAGLMGASATGNAKQQALQKGKSLGEAWTYGIFSGLSDSALEYFLGSIPGLSNMKGLSNLIRTSSQAKEIVAKLVCDAFCEGTEEYIQQWIQTGIDYVYGEDIDLGEVNEEALEAFCMGVGLSILNAGNKPVNEAMNSIVTYEMNGKKYTMIYDDIMKKYNLKKGYKEIKSIIKDYCEKSVSLKQFEEYYANKLINNIYEFFSKNGWEKERDLQKKVFFNLQNIKDADQLECSTITSWIFNNLLEKCGTRFVEKIDDIDIRVQDLDDINEELVIKKVNKIVSMWPESLKKGVKKITFYEASNCYDTYWTVEYKIICDGIFCSNATGGRGEINIWGKRYEFLDNYDGMNHEAGHCLDHSLGGISDQWTWRYAAEEDFKISGKISVSDYGANAIKETGKYQEDFADSVKKYINNKTEFEKIYPNRAKILENILL